MAIGVVSDSDFELELDKSDKSPTPELRPAQVIDSPIPGRKDGDLNVPDSLRKVIGEESHINGRASAVEFARGFGVSESSVSAYNSGKTSTSASKQNSELAEYLKEARLKFTKKAGRRLNKALNAITDDKLTDLKATDLAIVAKTMSGIIKDMEPSAPEKSGDTNFNGPSIVLYNPGFTKEDRFESLEVNE